MTKVEEAAKADRWDRLLLLTDLLDELAAEATEEAQGERGEWFDFRVAQASLLKDAANLSRAEDRKMDALGWGGN